MAASANKGLVGLMKRGWNEIPEVIGSAGMALVGAGLIVAANVIYYNNDGDNRKYRQHYTVYRHDDPRVEKLKIKCDLTCPPEVEPTQ